MSDPLADIHEALTESRVYVHPDLRGDFTPAQLTAIEDGLTASEQPVFVVVWPLAYEDAYGGRPEELLAQLHDRYDVPGTYVTPNIFENGEYYLTDKSWDVTIPYSEVQPYEAGSAARDAHPDDLAAGLVEMAKIYGANDRSYLEELEQKTPEDTGTGTSTPAGDPTSGDDGGVPTGAVVGVLLALLAVAVAGAAWRARRKRGAAAAYSLPRSAAERIREAHDDRLEERARADVLGLGEAIDAAEITQGGDRGSWQQTLDHYDAARRVLRGSDPDVLDVVGAIVLAERGQAALRAALAGRPYTPAAPCFLNPLHGLGGSDRTVEVGGERVRAPLCRRCAADLAKGRRPDILDVLRHGEPVHYFDTDARPWASTGYGALQPDLVRELHRRT